MRMSGKSAMALRTAFGDRKPPDISRKITACVACRKLKIKCSMPAAGPPCERCKKRSLSCTVNKSLQMLLESDLSWKDDMEQRLAILENSIATLVHQHYEPVDKSLQGGSSLTTRHPSQSAIRSIHSNMEQDGQHQWEIVVDGNGTAEAVPASYLAEVSTAPFTPHRLNILQKPLDVIASGILNIESASVLFSVYRDRLDHFVYSTLGSHRSLQEVRDSSPLLADAICAVGSLYSGKEDYARCRSAFMQQVSKQMFSKRHCADNVRGLLVGAFWLSDLSWALVGAAVRIATEINLHRSFIRPAYGSREWYQNARLYLLVWICDHHLSIVYGRSPMTESFSTLEFGKGYLSSEHASQDDTRLFSQVEIWMISYRTYKTFGIDNEAALPNNCLSDFRRIEIALETWRADCEERFTFDEHLGNYPRKRSGLHYHFAKLYLCSHAYRGLLNAQTLEQTLLPGVEEFGAKAITAADSILRVIINDSEIQSYLSGLPTYYDTMIAFAVVFLLKAVSKVPEGLRLHLTETLELLNEISVVLIEVTAQMRPEHILCSISQSVKKLVDRAAQNVFEDRQQLQAASNLPSWGQNFDNNDFAWLMSPENSMFVGNFDLTGTAYDIDFNFMDTSPTI